MLDRPVCPAQELLAALAQGGPDAAVGSLPPAREMARRLQSASTSCIGGRNSSLISGRVLMPVPSTAAARGLGNGRAEGRRSLRSVDTGALAHELRQTPAPLRSGASKLLPCFSSQRHSAASLSPQATGCESHVPPSARASTEACVQQQRSYMRAHAMRISGAAPPPQRVSSEEGEQGNGYAMLGFLGSETPIFGNDTSGSQRRAPALKLSGRPRSRTGIVVGSIAEEVDALAGLLECSWPKFGGGSNAVSLASPFVEASVNTSPVDAHTAAGEAGVVPAADASATVSETRPACGLPADAYELLRRRTWARLAGGALRPIKVKMDK